MDLPISFKTQEGVDCARLVCILRYRKARVEEAMRIGELAFKYHDTYGLSETDIWNTIKEVYSCQ